MRYVILDLRDLQDFLDDLEDEEVVAICWQQGQVLLLLKEVNE